MLYTVSIPRDDSAKYGVKPLSSRPEKSLEFADSFSNVQLDDSDRTYSLGFQAPHLLGYDGDHFGTDDGTCSPVC
jgi:hypothetical protein